MPESQYIYIASVKYEDGSPVEGANVKIINSLGELKQQKSEADGVFTITLSPETDYLITITKPEYFNQKDKFSTKGLEGIITLRGEFLMRSMAQSIELENILYDFGRWELRPESEESLNGLVEILNDNPTISIEIASHSDSRGDSAVNMRISQRRAQSVVDFLIGKGISADRLKAQGYGESQPRIVTAKIATQYKFLREGDVLNDDFMRRYVHSKEEEEIVDQLNRRTEFTVISNTEQ
jgi:peptidoglycan-associated lipoprotein